jgi:hypothetical protein
MKNGTKYSFLRVALPSIRGLKTSCPKKPFALILLLAPVFAFGLDSKDFDKHFSVSVQPYTNWFYTSGYYLDYNLEPSVFTTVELSLSYKKYLKLLFDFDINTNDNLVGELADSKAFARIAGMLGFKNFALRAAWGQIEGEAAWKGAPILGQPQSTPVSTKYTELSLLYNWPIVSLGLMYQNYHVPVALSYGYDDDLAFNYYGAYFGMSTFNEWMNRFKQKQEGGVRIWLDQNLSLGVAVGEVSEEGQRRRRFGEIVAEDKRDGGSVIDVRDSSPLAVSANLQWIAGLCGGFSVGNFLLGFGAGYDGFVQLYSSLNYNSILVRHGAVARVYCSF